MRRILQGLAVTVLLAGGAIWLSAGAHRGWTKTSVPVKSIDEITGIEGITYKRQFVPGLDLLGSSLLAASVLASASLIFSRKTKPTNNTDI